MPDHLHMLMAISGDTQLSALIRDFKRIIARLAGIHWQRSSSITAYVAMKAKTRKLSISARIRFALD